MREQTWRQWVRCIEREPGATPSLLRKGCLAPLTGQDAKVLDAIVACWKLYAISDEAGQRVALASVTLLLHGMQEKTRWLARELIPFVFDWTDRERLWSLVTGDLRAIL